MSTTVCGAPKPMPTPDSAVGSAWPSRSRSWSSHLPDDDERPATGEAAWRRRRYRAPLAHAAAREIDGRRHRHTTGMMLPKASCFSCCAAPALGPWPGSPARRATGSSARCCPGTVGRSTTWLDRRTSHGGRTAATPTLDRLRNRVRHEVLPQLENASPRLRHHLVNLAGAIAEAEDFMAAELGRSGDAFADPWDPTGGVDIRGHAEDLPRALRTRWLHGQMLRLGDPPHDPAPARTLPLDAR